jgi:hypothetical protein
MVAAVAFDRGTHSGYQLRVPNGAGKQGGRAPARSGVPAVDVEQLQAELLDLAQDPVHR